MLFFRLKCTKFDFGWDSAPNPAGGLQHSPDPLAGILVGLLLRGGRGRERNRGKGREGEGVL